MIDDNWDEAEGQAEELEERFAEHPEVLARLAIRYGKLGRLDDERRAWRNTTGCRRIAGRTAGWPRSTGSRGRLDLWESMLEEFLKLPDDYRAATRVGPGRIGASFMSRGEFGRADALRRSRRTDRRRVGVSSAPGRRTRGPASTAAPSRSSAPRPSDTPSRSCNGSCSASGRAAATPSAAARHAETFVEGPGGRMTENEVGLVILFYDLAGEPKKGPRSSGRCRRGPPRKDKPAAGSSAGSSRCSSPGSPTPRATRRPATRPGAVVKKGANPSASKAAALFSGPGKGPLDVKAYDEAVASADPKSASYLGYFAGRYQQRHGAIKNAVSLWERCGEVPGGGSFVPMLATNAHPGKSGRATARRRALARGPRRIRRTAGRVNAAKADCDAAIRLDPKFCEAFHTRGLARRSSGDLDGALSDFGKAVELAPDDPHAHVGKAITLILLGKYSEAAEETDRAIDLAPGTGRGTGRAVFWTVRQGRDAAARKAFAYALKLDPGLGTALEVLKKALKVRPKVKLTGGRPASRAGRETADGTEGRS